MATAVIMPRQGQSVESCIIGEWHKKKGDPIQIGDILFTYETDKATFDEEAKAAGELIAVFFAEGDDVPCLLNVCVIGAAGEAWESYVPEGATLDGAGQAAAAETAAGSFGAAETEEPSAGQGGGEGSERAAASQAQGSVDLAAASAAVNAPLSPRARAAAEKAHADLRYAQATGPNGRIIERDVDRLVAAGHLATAAAGDAYAAGLAGTGLGGRVRVEDLNAAVPAAELAGAGGSVAAMVAAADQPEYEDKKLPNIRKVIAKAMHQSISSMAQLTLNTSADASDMLALRARLKKAKEAGLDERLGFSILQKVPTFNDIVLYALSRTVLDFPDCNAHFLDDKMRYFHHVNLGVAVDTPRGLMVPVVKHADLLSISQISAEVKRLAAACNEGNINPDELKGSSITVTNLGSLGIESFTPVINPPETCILGVDNLSTKFRMVQGEAKAYQAIGLSLTLDHRAVDGAPAARFLQALVKNLENFSLLMMEK